MRNKETLYRLCPHVVLEPQDDGRIAVRSRFISPPGTVAWQCQECGRTTHDTDFIQNNIQHWAKHPEQYVARRKKMGKINKKL